MNFSDSKRKRKPAAPLWFKKQTHLTRTKTKKQIVIDNTVLVYSSNAIRCTLKI